MFEVAKPILSIILIIFGATTISYNSRNYLTQLNM